MKSFSDFLPFVTPFAPSAPDPLATHYIRQAAIDFCQRTRFWRYVDEFDVAGDTTEIIAVPGQSSLFEIEKAWFQPTSESRWVELTKKPYAEIDQSLLDQEANTYTLPNIISQIDYNSVTLVPRASGKLRISMFLTPSYDAKSCPDNLFNNFASTIADGALSDILMIPEQPYTNPNLAALKGGIFNAECDRNFALNIRGQQRAPARAKSSFM